MAWLSTYNTTFLESRLSWDDEAIKTMEAANGSQRLHAAQTNGAVRPIVRKKAATCLLRLIRKSPPEAEILQPDVWSVKLVRSHL